MAGEVESNDGQLFAGVRFVLFGFDSVSEALYRSELVRRGGIDVGRYDSACTHVIVFGRVHDDQICAAARNDGKVLVTELWIEDSVDFSVLANPDRILYKPVKDLNGIPGSQSLIICLTGYQRRERDDIMKMVDLMGANFSKPLIASKVTHLVCYKFEGEKYELAKRVNIKLVNHQWLEDCLREWEILPEENYKMSGWELEIMQAEAKNSDDEADDYSSLRPARKRSLTAENKDILQMSKSSSKFPTNSIIKQESPTPKSLSSTSNVQNLSSDTSHLLSSENIAKELNQNGGNELPAIADELKSVSPNCHPTESCRNSVPSEDCPQTSALKGQRSSTLSSNGRSPRLWNALPLKRKVPGLKSNSSLATPSPEAVQRSSDSRGLGGKNRLVSPTHPSSGDFSSPSNAGALLRRSEASMETGSSSSMKNTVESLGALSIDNPKVDLEPSDKRIVLISDLPDEDSGMMKSAYNNSNPSRRVPSKALIKRVVAKRKISCASKTSSEQSNKLVKESEGEKGSEESNEMAGLMSTEPKNSSTEKISPKSVNQTSWRQPGSGSTEAGEPLVNEKSEKVNALRVKGVTKGKVRSAHRLALTPSPDDAEKENKSTVNTRKKDESSGKSSQRQIIPEPSWFIFSGHRLQRKEFQKIIKRLRGRVCRDSHSWSYQATHFIAPDPLRRTEKFFAAAASGRWILKSDYLGACNEAGRFLPEEAFEWAGGELTEDGAISLEAPRKWRHLKERTGQGAFFGTRIVIYGECIAPSLETLKRAVKAGEGEVLATSPPYTRAMNVGVDFAVVSAGTPRGDPWVEEFLRLEIPCVLSDYLVDLVCKPGYPLDRHVLYGSHSSAEKSFSELIRRHQ